MNTTKFALILAVSLVLSLVLAVPPASASFIATMQESGPDVVVTCSGSLDITALTLSATGNFSTRVRPFVGELRLGPTNSVPRDQYGSISGPLSFGTGGITNATSGTGDKVGVRGTGAVLYVPQGYMSGSLSATNTWSGQTIASLGATPGTYVWSWGSGCDPTRVNSEDPSTVTVAEVPAAAVVATLRFPVVTTAKSSIDKAAVLDDALSFPRDTSPTGRCPECETPHRPERGVGRRC